MSGYDVVIRRGGVVLPSGVVTCDVGIRGGRIAALGERLEDGREEIGAEGRLVLPGGVDAHCHLNQPTGDGTVMADDFFSGSVSAACGGTTTVIPFACQMKGHSLGEAVDDYHHRAKGRSVIDYAFHLIVSDPTETVLVEELPALIGQGYTSFKIYMTYDDLKLSDGEILDVLAVARANGALTMIHAENAECIAWLTRRLVTAGQTAPRFHAAARPAVVEREAAHRAISLAELIDVPILLVHVSGGQAIEQIRWARRRGLSIYAETCPQYLFLTEADLRLEGFEGAKFICSPPPRDRQDQERVWEGLQDGLFNVFSSDHAPFRYQDPKGKMVRGADAPFLFVPNGIPGLETRLPLLFSAGVKAGRIDLARFVELTAANPARMYGLYPRKGSITIGADADLAIWDSEREVTIRNEDLHHNVDYTPYEGQVVRGWPEVVLSRGAVIVRDGQVLAKAGRGRFLTCGRPEPAQPRQSPAGR
ncbi:MAG TPA: dihydropyrimidinase [bacterium]|nr:dihydropyrimidinase [bacterium]